MLLDDLTAEMADKTVHSVAHAVVRLEELAPAYGAERRRVRIVKYRGVRFRGGYHDVTITTGGLNVFPRLVASEFRTYAVRSQMSSGIAELDKLLGGGIEAGSGTLILGPAGTGKSLIATGIRLRSDRARRKGGVVHLRRRAWIAVLEGQGHGNRP